jgi:hypothetical protein
MAGYAGLPQPMRVILEIGKKRKVVAGAVDWPGLDRSGGSDEAAIETLTAYRARYAGVAERAGLGSSFERAGAIEVVERVPGSSSTDFWGIAHVPSEWERDVLSLKDLERRLSLLLEIKELTIDPEAVDPEDVEMLQDMVLAATNEALRSAQELAANKMQQATGGLGGPGGLGLPGL